MKTLDFSNPDWAYFLGVVHGDGNISTRSICIAIGYNAIYYKESIICLLDDLGLHYKICNTKSAIRVDINNTKLTNVFREYKKDGKWFIPPEINIENYIAGIIDTDGCVSNTSTKLSKHRKMAVIINLKRSGNLLKVGALLTQLGFRDIVVHNRIMKYNKKPYPFESLCITGMDRLKLFNDKIKLRHKLKKEKMDSIIKGINEFEFKKNKSVPQQLAEQLKVKPMSIIDIMTTYNLTKSQADSAMQNLRKKHKIQSIPPVPTYTTYKII